MGHIYKITNKINGKVYVGQTIKPVEKRFSQHRHNYDKPYFEHLVLYKAFKKYGLENFVFEEIESVDDSLLDEREKYWISFYNSYYDGYNSTLGGRTVSLYSWDIDDIVEKYMTLKSARKVAAEIGCDHSTIDHILNQYGVKRFSPSEQKSREIKFSKNGEEIIFKSSRDAAIWMMENNITKNKNYVSVRQEITARARKHKTFFGYTVEYI